MSPMMKRIFLFCTFIYGCKSSTHNPYLQNSQLSGLKSENDHIPLSTAINLIGVWDYELREDGTSRCIDMVEKATSTPHFNKMISFIPTYYFLVDHEATAKEGLKGESVAPGKWVHSLVKANQFCVLTDASNCEPIGPSTIPKLKEGLTKCFQKVVEKGAGITVVPHLDDGERKGQWRNAVIFDPFPHQDPSCQGKDSDYFCGFLKPIGEALRDARRPETPVYMSTQGEMGATVFTYPGKHGQLVRILREVILGVPHGKAFSSPLVKTGINLNFNEIFGLFPAKRVSREGVNYLLGGADFVGISAYAPIKRIDGKIRLWSFDASFEKLNTELKLIGLNLRDYKNLELHFSEVGLGGSPDSSRIARTDEEALSCPYYGINKAYNPRVDPWQTPSLKKTRFDYYCALIQYLAKPELQSWPIKHAFLWSMASWDVQGIYPDSKSPLGSYADERISAMIAAYNRTGEHSCEKLSPPSPELKPQDPTQSSGKAPF